MNKKNDNTTLVYSTECGRILKSKKKIPVKQNSASQHILYVQHQIRGYKEVCLISGKNLDETLLKKLALYLKKQCSCGGTLKNGIIEIQGNNLNLIKSLLEKKGFKVTLISK